MKKIFAILMTICLLASVLCITAFAADAPADGTVLRISGENKRGDRLIIDEYDTFKDGWNAAMTVATDAKKSGYVRIIVDLYADWTAVDGEFSDDLFGGAGFAWDTILFPEDVCVVLNMNGHTINRAMSTWEYNGEVMCIDPGAMVTINDGTIKGGWSANGAGGIHIKDGAYVTLNNVHIVGNIADDDDGGGIAVNDGATLIMNGGSFQNNAVDGAAIFTADPESAAQGAALYVEDAKATLNNVEFKNNQSCSSHNPGAGIASHRSDIVINSCTFDGNGISDEGNNIYAASSIIWVDDCNVVVKDSVFTNNGAFSETPGFGNMEYTYLFYMFDKCNVNIEQSIIDNNASAILFLGSGMSDYVKLCVTDTTMTNNKSCLAAVHPTNIFASGSYFKNCTISGNEALSTPGVNNMNEYFLRANEEPAGDEHVGTMMGTGSVTMVISLTALVFAVVALGLTIVSNKKKAAPATVAETEDEE